MKLDDLAWGLCPRRVGIYLAERGIDAIERFAFDALAGRHPSSSGSARTAQSQSWKSTTGR